MAKVIDNRDGLDALLAPSVDVTGLIEKLDFSEENLARATREQARLFIEASRYRVRQMRRRLSAVAVYEAACSSAALRLRRMKKAQAERKERGGMTEAAIRDQVNVDPVVVDRRRRAEVAQVHEEWSKLLVEAFRQRRDACRILAEVMGSEAAAELRVARGELESASLRKLKHEVRQRWPGEEDEV